MPCSLRSDDLCALLTLSNDAGALAAQPKACALRIAQEIAKLLSAWCVDIGRLPRKYADVDYRFPPFVRPFETFVYYGPVSPDAFEGVVTTWRAPAERDIAMMKIAADERSASTSTRDELVSDDEWFSSSLYRSVLKPAGVGDRLYASITQGQESPVVVCLSRSISAPKFTLRDREVLSLIRDSLLPWLADLFASAAQNQSTPAALGLTLESLSRAQLTVLVHMLNGLSEAEIGERIGRSKHTVHDHVKRLYETLDVSSRVELGLKIAPHRDNVEAMLAAAMVTSVFSAPSRQQPAERPQS